MAWLALVGTALSAYGAYQQGQSAADQARRQATEREFEAAQNEERAKAEIASSQRAANEEERQVKLVSSSATARARGGAGDPTIVHILSDLAAEGSYRGAVQLYEGQARARQARLGAEAARYEAAGYRGVASDYAAAGTIGAASSLIGGGADYYMRGHGGLTGYEQRMYGKYGFMPGSGRLNNVNSGDQLYGLGPYQ